MKKIIPIFLAIAFLSITGCKGFLTEEPVLAQSDVLTLSTFKGVNNAAAGAYAPLSSTTWYCGAFILSNEMRTMNGRRWIEFEEYNSGRYTDDYAIHFTPNSTSGMWSLGYYVILAANQVLRAIDDVEAEEADKDNIKAEMLFLRALAHFDIVRTFAHAPIKGGDKLGIPIITTVQAIDEKPARNTVDEVYTQIIEDLEDAEELIDPDYVRAGVNDAKASVSIYAIQALLSRVYLYNQNWQKAADYATKVINSGKFSIWKADELEDAYTTDVPTGGEVIFEVFGHTSQSYGTGLENTWGMTSFNQYGDCGASRDLQNLYAAGDARLALLSPDDKGNALFTMKYAGKGLGTIDASNTIVLRLSEMYLNRAEALAKGATIAGATIMSDLKAITDNRNATPTATLGGVYEERAKELAWEGHLWFDLARTGRKMTRTDVSGTTIPTTLEAGDYRWAMPIPDREFTVNPNLVQNDGYSK